MFIDRLNIALKNKNISGNALCKLLNMPNANYTNWKKQTPKGETIKKIADILDVTADWLLERTDETEKESKIISFYRIADDRGKDRIYKTAKDEADQAEQLLQKEDNITEFPEEKKPFA